MSSSGTLVGTLTLAIVLSDLVCSANNWPRLSCSDEDVIVENVSLTVGFSLKVKPNFNFIVFLRNMNLHLILAEQISLLLLMVQFTNNSAIVIPLMMHKSPFGNAVTSYLKAKAQLNSFFFCTMTRMLLLLLKHFKGSVLDRFSDLNFS